MKRIFQPGAPPTVSCSYVSLRKTLLGLLIVLIGIGSNEIALGQQPSQQYDSKHRNKYKLTDIPELQQKAERVFPDGSISFTDNAFLTENHILSLLRLDDHISFELMNQSKSRFDKSFTYRRYQGEWTDTFIYQEWRQTLSGLIRVFASWNDE